MNRNSKYGVDGRNLFGKHYAACPASMTGEQACKAFGHKPMCPSFHETFCRQCFVDLVRSVDGSFRPAIEQGDACQR
jgi:hypothetical protein